MATKKSPLARQKEEFGSKEKLVDRLITALGQVKKLEGDADDIKARFLAASNRQLLRLMDVAGEIREKFGSVERMAQATAEALGRAKDAPYVERLKALAPAKLLDAFRTAERRGRQSKSKSKSKTRAA
jgi:hypothetical protein